MRKVLLSLAVLALAVPAFRRQQGRQARRQGPDLLGNPGHRPQRRADQPLPVRPQGRRGRPRLPGQPLPGRAGLRRPDHRLRQRLQGQAVKVVGVCVNDMDSDRLPGIKEHMKEKKHQLRLRLRREPGHRPGLRRDEHPHFFVLDKDRNIRYIGAMDDNVIAKPRSRSTTSATPSTPSWPARPRRSKRPAQGCGIKYKKQQLSSPIARPAVAGQAGVRSPPSAVRP